MKKIIFTTTLIIFFSCQLQAYEKMAQVSYNYIHFNKTYKPSNLVNLGIELITTKKINLSAQIGYTTIKSDQKQSKWVPLSTNIHYHILKHKKCSYYAGGKLNFNIFSDQASNNPISVAISTGLTYPVNYKSTLFLEYSINTLEINQTDLMPMIFSIGYKHTFNKNEKGRSINKKINYRGPQLNKRTIIKNGKTRKDYYR